MESSKDRTVRERRGRDRGGKGLPAGGTNVAIGIVAVVVMGVAGKLISTLRRRRPPPSAVGSLDKLIGSNKESEALLKKLVVNHDAFDLHHIVASRGKTSVSNGVIINGEKTGSLQCVGQGGDSTELSGIQESPGSPTNLSIAQGAGRKSAADGIVVSSEVDSLVSGFQESERSTRVEVLPRNVDPGVTKSLISSGDVQDAISQVIYRALEDLDSDKVVPFKVELKVTWEDGYTDTEADVDESNLERIKHGAHPITSRANELLRKSLEDSVRTDPERPHSQDSGTNDAPTPQAYCFPSAPASSLPQTKVSPEAEVSYTPSQEHISRTIAELVKPSVSADDFKENSSLKTNLSQLLGRDEAMESLQAIVSKNIKPERVANTETESLEEQERTQPLDKLTGNTGTAFKVQSLVMQNDESAILSESLNSREVLQTATIVAGPQEVGSVSVTRVIHPSFQEGNTCGSGEVNRRSGGKTSKASVATTLQVTTLLQTKNKVIKQGERKGQHHAVSLVFYTAVLMALCGSIFAMLQHYLSNSANEMA